jgi:hypothetical protein
MERFLEYIREMFFVLFWFVIIISFIGGIGELDHGGGGLAGGALIAAAILIAAAKLSGRSGRQGPK